MWRLGIAMVMLAAGVLSEDLVAQSSPATRYRAGYETLRITDDARNRPIHLDVWYPAETEETTHRYGLSSGSVAAGAPFATGPFPVILLSHGALGTASNYSWIAERLARSSFVVLGVSHFGESSAFGEATINAATVADFGSGLARVKAPALVIGSADNDFMPFALNPQRYVGFLPNVELIRLDRGEGHFVYLDECSLPVEALGVRICSDRPGVMRGDVHQRLGASIVEFFTRRLRAQAEPSKP